MPGLQTNSLDKIAVTYFAGVTKNPFEYAGEVFQPKKVVVSPLIFRGTTCPPACGGCCFRFSLLYLPSDPHPEYKHLRRVLLECNGVQKELLCDTQQDHTDHFCRHLNKINGRCGIHGEHPFSCDFETLKVLHREDTVYLTNKLFGRGWSYERVTGQIGALCDILPASEFHRDSAVRKLKRLKEWCDYFALETWLPEIIAWCEKGPHDSALTLSLGKRTLYDMINQSEENDGGTQTEGS